MNETIKYFLDESRIPKAWYNIQADLPKPAPAVLHPGTHKPVGPDDLAPLFRWNSSCRRLRRSVRC